MASKKRLVAIFAALTVVTALCLTACAGCASAPEDSSSSASASTSASSASSSASTTSSSSASAKKDEQKKKNADKDNVLSETSATADDQGEGTAAAQSTDSGYDGGGSSDNGSADNGGSGGGNASSGGGNQGSSQPQQAAPAAEPEKHWIEEQGHYEQVCVQEPYDEPEYDYVAVCNGCGCNWEAAGGFAHVRNHGCPSGGTGFCSSWQQVGTTHHDGVYEDRWVVDVPGHWE